MRFLFFNLLLFVVMLSATNAQSYSKFSMGASIQGQLTGTILSGNSTELVRGNQTYETYTDSVSELNNIKGNFGITFWAFAFLTKRWTIQAGIGYLDVGFNRTQDNIQFMDTLYPGIGQGLLAEKSGGSGEKSIVFNYKYQYLQLPVLVNYDVYHSKDFFYKLSIQGGIGLNFLLNHEITARLNQFVVEGNDTYHFDSTGFEAKHITMNIMLGAKGEYRVDKRTIVFVNPVIGFYPISVSSGPILSYPYYFQLNVGLQYAFSLFDDKRK